MHGVLVGLRPGGFYNKRKMDEGLAKAAKVQRANEDIAKILANKTLGTRIECDLVLCWFMFRVIFRLLYRVGFTQF